MLSLLLASCIKPDLHEMALKEEPTIQMELEMEIELEKKFLILYIGM